MLNYYINNQNKFLFILHCLILCITSYFFLHFDYFLLCDYPNYLARINLYNHLSDTQQILSEYYYKDMKITPYMAFPVFVSMLEPVVGIYWAGKLFIVFAISVIISGGVFLNYTLYNRITPFSLLLHIFIFNYTLSMGFLNFTLGLGLILWGFALWIRYHHNTLKFYALFSIYGIVIFFCHVFALFLLGLLIGLYQLSLKPMTSVKGFFKAAFYASLKVLTFTLIPMIITLMIRDNNGIGFPTVTAYIMIFDNIFTTCITPLLFDTKIYTRISVILFGSCLILKKLEFKQPFIIVCLSVLAFFVPFWVFGVAYVNIRIPALVGLLFAVSATFKGEKRHIVFCSVLTGIISIFVYMNNIQMLYHHNQQVNEFIHTIKDDKNLAGKKLLTVNDKFINHYLWGHEMNYANLSSYAVLEANMFVPEMITYIPPISLYKKYKHIDAEVGEPILSNEIRASDAEVQKYVDSIEAEMITPNYYWQHWRHDFDYVLWIHFKPKPKDVPAELTPYKKGSFFTLYKIEK